MGAEVIDPDGEWKRRFAWLPVKVENRWIWFRFFYERGYKVFVERKSYHA